MARFRREQIGMIFQFFNLLDDLTVADNVLLPAQLAGMPRAEARATGWRAAGRAADRASTATPIRRGCLAVSGSGSRSPGRW